MTAAAQVTMTDPARELAELCEHLRQGGAKHARGEDHLAKIFDVDPWSLEFFEIVFTIVQRVHAVIAIIHQLDMDSDFKGEISSHLQSIAEAFSSTSMRASWSEGGLSNLSRENVQPLKGISGQVRQIVSYIKLSDEEVSELISEVVQLQDWLSKRNLAHNDFIRSALMEGLDRVHFRLVRLNWVGWGYTLESLREVIAAYLMLERSGVTAETNPDAEAVLLKVGSVIRAVYDKVQTAKATTETADWLIRFYAVGSAINQGKPIITALLGN